MGKKSIGLIVNPVAGMGGRVGLKGTDGIDVLNKAKRLGATPQSPQRAIEALRVIKNIGDEIELFTCPQEMGENEARACGFSPVIIKSIKSRETTSDDTQRAAREMKKLGVDLLLFAGGDGTARDVCSAVGQEITVLGIPAGVKMHSGVYALTPRHAGDAAVMFLKGTLSRVKEAEVMDIDEEAFRIGIVTARLYGYLKIPDERRFIQSVKSGGIQGEKEITQGIAADLLESMEADCLYIFGPGTTTRDILIHLGLEKTLLGVDAVLNKRLVGVDVNEGQLARLIDGRKAKIVITVIGGQGYIFGRGNQQISPEIIKKVGKENIVIVASKEKLSTLHGGHLLVDTGDEDVDKGLYGYWRVLTGFNDYVMYKVGSLPGRP